MPIEKIFETDVLIIGGGLAGCIAAIKAKEKGVDVTLVDKSYVSKSGQTPWAHCTTVFNPEWLAWVMLKEKDGEMELFKQTIPQEWMPDPDQPYEVRYPVRIPGE